MTEVVNIAAYRFAPLDGLKPLRAELLAFCKARGLKGTILLSTEGINLFVAGGRMAIEALLDRLRGITGLESLTAKYSESAQQPFRRMLVRIKKEIIAFGVDGIDPVRHPSPKLSPQELKRWLDEGRPVTLLDTRNDYEVKLGTFRNAVTLGLDHFRNFPRAIEQLPAEMKQQPVVMFCTGGIRCEKAGPYMQRAGFEQILQLDGGILKYFEDCGGEHYDGDCFVFDGRVGVDPALAETESTLCFHCLNPLDAADRNDPRYRPGVSCPACFRTAEEHQQTLIARREAAIRLVTTPLPGSQPYDNFRPINIPLKHDGQSLIAALCGIFSHLPREEWLARCAAGKLVGVDRRIVNAEHPVRAGECYLHRIPAAAEPDVNPQIRILYEDEAIVVADKPAPLPLHPCGRFNRNTLQAILNEVYRPQKLRPVHRLDANTTGIVVLARTKNFASRIQPQFAEGGVRKVYLARVHGWPAEDRFSCELAIGEEPAELGVRVADESGRPARTEFRVLQRFADRTALLEVVPLTGRTNQIRVHLWQMGHAILGDQAYLADGTLGEVMTHAIHDAPLCLHASEISFVHPARGEQMTLRSELPAWCEGVAQGLTP